MARIRETLPGSSFTESFSAKRIVSQLGKGDTTMTAMHLATARVVERIKAQTPVGETGELKKSIDGVPKVRTPNPRIDISGVVYGAYVEHGTKFVGPNPYIAPVMKKRRAEWEADVRETKANLDKKAEAAEKKEREPRGRKR